VELIVNGSGSYMELRKAYVTVDLVKSATLKVKSCVINCLDLLMCCSPTHVPSNMSQFKLLCGRIKYPNPLPCNVNFV
jgi:hypothetical protein